ncbi:helix-turn-helix domain-containing protein [Blautia sp. RD014232]|nr:helix-turn-helix domain-containing protein [Blautia parvula]MCB4352334.1 helix-turn-helix domain-containing protein [Blautia sp. RD014232]
MKLYCNSPAFSSPGDFELFTLKDRIYIENSLCKGYTFKDIAKYLGIDSTTISKEVKTHCFSD